MRELQRKLRIGGKGGGGGGGGGGRGREVQDSPLVESFSADLLKAIESYWTELHFCNNNEATQ